MTPFSVGSQLDMFVPDKVERPEAAYNQVGQIIAYESGELTSEDTLVLFSHLVKTGLAWQLQGHYGRTAAALISNGWLSRDGDIPRTLPDEA